MGGQHAFAQRAVALSMACIGSIAVVLFFLSGKSCSFVEVNPAPGQTLVTSAGISKPGVDVSHIGLTCNALLLDSGPDEMLEMSQHFFYLSLGIGGATAFVAWILSVWIQPTKCSWITMAIMGSVTAVVQVPIFLIFESEPCTMDVTRQTCSLGLGAYFNIASIAFWVGMTLWAQCIRAPQWEMDHPRSTAQKRERVNIREIVIPNTDTESGSSNEDEHEWVGNTETKQKSRIDVESGVQGKAAVSPRNSRSVKSIVSPVEEIDYDGVDDVSEMTSGITEWKAAEPAGKSAATILNDLERMSA